MNKKRIIKNILEVFILIMLVVFDQFTKYLAIQNLKNSNPFVIIKDFLEFNYLENRGAAFGILQNARIFFIIITIIIVFVIIFSSIKIDKLIYTGILKEKAKVKFTVLQWVLVALFAGAVGNLIDRIRFNYVVDFIYFKIINFPTFNIADIYVTLSAIALVIIIFFVLKSSDIEKIKNKGDSDIAE